MRLVGPVVMVAALAVDGGVAGTGHVPVRALDGWNRYVAAVESRRAGELTRPGRFLVMDGGATARADRHGVLSGAMAVRRMDPATSASAGAVEVADGMVHHWWGAVLLRGVTLDDVMERLQSEAPPTSAEVLRAEVIARAPSFIKVFLRVQRTKLVTAVYNTEHEVTFTRIDTSRASSRSVATRIVEVDQAGTPGEHELAPGDDRGFLWRLNAYWRYEMTPGGVIAECESISLSRDVPFGLGAIAGPIIRSTARESMERTLESLRGMAVVIKTRIDSPPF